MENAVSQALFYKDGFFGYGEADNFKYWSLAHFIPIILLGLGIFLVFRFREKLKNWKHEENLRFIFAFIMIIVEMSYFWRILYAGSGKTDEIIDLLDKLPVQVCGWTCIACCFMMMKKSQALYQICFFVCLTLGIFPLLTPSVINTTGPLYYRYYQFWLEHTLPILGLFYMTFVHGFRPRLTGIGWATGFMAVLTTFAMICNFNIPGANYLYLATGTLDEGGGSLMDTIVKIAPDVWVRLALLSVIVIALFFIAYFIYIGITRLYTKLTKSK